MFLDWVFLIFLSLVLIFGFALFIFYALFGKDSAGAGFGLFLGIMFTIFCILQTRIMIKKYDIQPGKVYTMANNRNTVNPFAREDSGFYKVEILDRKDEFVKYKFTGTDEESDKTIRNLHIRDIWDNLLCRSEELR